MNELHINMDTLELPEELRSKLMTKAIALGERLLNVQYTRILPNKTVFKCRILTYFNMN